MRRRFYALAATIALTGGLLTAAVAVAPGASAAGGSCDSNIESKDFTTPYLLDHAPGALVTTSSIGESSCYSALEDGSSKWYELKDASGEYGNQCLEITGITGGYAVTTGSCNFRSAQLWWLDNDQIINQYGDTLLGHDACMWYNDTGIAPLVEDCVASQPLNQLWTYDF